MKNSFLLLFLLISFSAFSQSNLNFEEIKKNVQDSTSVYFYEKLLYKFAYMPMSMDSLEIKHLYYGKFAAKKNDVSAEILKTNFYPLIQKHNFKEAIAEGEKLLKNDPADLEVLGLLVQSYTMEDKENRMLPLRGLQFKRLVDTILEHATGDEKHKTYTVMAVADEYVIAGVQNINLFNYRRKSEHSANGMIDHWKSGRKRISFHVIYY